MATIVTRLGSGLPLTGKPPAGPWQGDTNFTNLNNAKLNIPPGTPVAGNLATWTTGGATLQDGGYNPDNLLITDNHIEGTTNKIITNTEKTKLITLKHTKIVQVAANGTFIYNPYGWSITKVATGWYRITHNTNNIYHMDMPWCTDANGIAYQINADANWIEVGTYNFSNQMADFGFNVFLLYMDLV